MAEHGFRWLPGICATIIAAAMHWAQPFPCPGAERRLIGAHPDVEMAPGTAWPQEGFTLIQAASSQGPSPSSQA